MDSSQLLETALNHAGRRVVDTLARSFDFLLVGLSSHRFGCFP